MAQIRKDDIGTKLRITASINGSVVDINSASAMTIFLRKPGRTVLTKTAVLSTDGTNGKFEYITVAGDVNEQGLWRIQGKVVLTSGTFRTAIGGFNVGPKIENL